MARRFSPVQRHTPAQRSRYRRDMRKYCLGFQHVAAAVPPKPPLVKEQIPFVSEQTCTDHPEAPVFNVQSRRRYSRETFLQARQSRSSELVYHAALPRLVEYEKSHEFAVTHWGAEEHDFTHSKKAWIY